MAKAPKFDPVAEAEAELEARAAARAADTAAKKAAREGPDLRISEKAAKALTKHDRYIITSAQNNTPIDESTWGAIKRMAEETGAKIVVVPSRYRNPTSPGENDGDVSWEPAVEEHLVGSAIKVHDYLAVMGDWRIQPTAKNPLEGQQGIGRGASVIFGHPQLAMEMVATPQFDLPKMVTTTGTVTRPNYSDSRAGKRAEFAHSPGGLFVERDGDRFHLRQLCADSEGGFYDLDRYYHADGVESLDRAEALVLGDTHVWFQDPKVTHATYDADDSIVNVLRPRRIVHHDLIDSYSISHHHLKDPFVRELKRSGDADNLRQEIDDAAEFLRTKMPPDTETVIVASNHHEHIRRWLCDTDWRDDPTNAGLYLEMALAVVNSGEMGPGGYEGADPFVMFMKKKLHDYPIVARFLRRDESYRVLGIELSLHGDKGPNGARGTMRNFDLLGTKAVTAHRHFPGIFRGHWGVGTSTPELEYSKSSPSSWMNTHCAIYPNGKRQLLNIIKGRYRRPQ